MSVAALTGAYPAAGALRAYSAPILAVDDRLLNLTGRVAKALAAIWARCGSDYHIATAEVAGLARCDYRSARRAIDELVASGDLVHRPDPYHPVGWEILPPGEDGGSGRGGGQSCPGGADVSPSYVLRKSASALHVGREEGDRAPPGQDCPPPLPDPPSPRDPGEPLYRVLGRLESDPSAIDACVNRLGREFGAAFEPFYRQTCKQVLEGRLAVGALIGAAEEALQPHIRRRGPAFTASIRRRLAPPVHLAETPGPEPEPEPEPEPPAALATGTEPDPVPPAALALAPRPEPGPDRDAILGARFDALPAPSRAAIEARARRDNPLLARFPVMVRAACLGLLEARDAATLDALMDADDPAMRLAAARTLCDSGRGDLVVERILDAKHDFAAAGRKTGGRPG